MSKLFRFIALLCLVLSTVGVRAAVGVGDNAPALDIRLLDGKSMNLATLKKRPVLVSIWATWCPPCTKEMVDLQKLYERYHGKGLEVVAISLDTDRAPVDDFLKARGITYPVAMSVPRHNEVFGPMLFPPRLYLIGPDGKVALVKWGAVGFDELEARVRSML